MLKAKLGLWGSAVAIIAVGTLSARCTLEAVEGCRYTGKCQDGGGGGGGVGGTSGSETGGTSSGGVGGSGGSVEAGASGGVAESGGASGGAGEGGAGGEGGGNGGSCDTTLSPSDAPCVATDAQALFVAPTGTDTAAGTRAEPLASIGAALELAAESGKVVIACNATYDERLSVTTGARLYGGFACPDSDTPWAYEDGARAIIAPSAIGPVLEIRNVIDAVTIEDVEFDAADATENGESSIAAIVESSPSVALRRVRLVAGNGAKGADGDKGTKGGDGSKATNAQDGLDALCGEQAPGTRDGGGWLTSSGCGSIGGTGGRAIKGGAGDPGSPGSPRENVLEPGLKNGGSDGGGDGQLGSSGLPGIAGKAASSSTSFSPLGYTPPLPGGNGTSGFTGQGGGGGGASNGKDMCIGASGGAGGMGGCGGKGGTGGGAGGASVALLMWNSGVTLDACELLAGRGGDGGKGGDGGLGGGGSDGAPGGDADTANAIGKGGNGGKGGDGGDGGPGAGGNGGPSFAIVVHGTAPTKVNGTESKPGSPGARGLGGNANTLADGRAGLAAPQFNAP